MRHHRLWLGLVLVALLTIAGCEDDDCPTCPEEKQLTVAIGSARLMDEYLSARGHVAGINGQEPDLDSIRVHGRLATIAESELGPAVRQFDYYETTSLLVSSDTLHFEFFCNSGVSTCALKLLSFTGDMAYLISGHQDYDSGSTAAFCWNRSPNAEWYYIETRFDYRDSTGEVASRKGKYLKSIDDTTLVIPGDSLEYNGFLLLTIEVGTGVGPTSTEGNIFGGTMRGRVRCSHSNSYRMQVGSESTPSTELIPPESLEDRNHRLYQEMNELFAE